MGKVVGNRGACDPRVGFHAAALSICTAFALFPKTILISGVVPAGGLLGVILADYLSANMNIAGAVILTVAAAIVSVYLLSSFTMSKLASWFAPLFGWVSRRADAFRAWRAERARIAKEKAAEKARIRAEKRAVRRQAEQERKAAEAAAAVMVMEPKPSRKRRVREDRKKRPSWMRSAHLRGTRRRHASRRRSPRQSRCRKRTRSPSGNWRTISPRPPFRSPLKRHRFRNRRRRDAQHS